LAYKHKAAGSKTLEKKGTLMICNDWPAVERPASLAELPELVRWDTA